ncbi:MAG TPA: FAD/NAD(P)-binding protein [Micropepsaceae bacterium]|jgi:spermidine dehydrogenase|nr:FAD/NAD(P)-binding protein [Micropepsaceae bacterium]
MTTGDNGKTPQDRDLGMDRPIDRRDFLNGMVMGAAALSSAVIPGCAPAAVSGAPQDMPDYYPPTRTGMRGNHPGAFETAHSLRDGTFWQTAQMPNDTDGVYDLVIVGGGISGLSAAHFYRAARPNARILILDNHDDFGGHAKRNEFRLNGQLHLLNGGTELIDSPRAYSPAASGLLKQLGIDPVALSKDCDRPEIYDGLGPATFFDKETFGTDRLVTGGPAREDGEQVDWPAFLAKAPLPEDAKRDILRIETERIDYFPGQTSDQKKEALSRMSYGDFLSKAAKAGPVALAYYQKITHDEWGVGIDAEPALDCWGFGFPGFQGLNLEPGSYRRMGYTAAGYEDGGSDTFHFPDGNASIARLLIRDLIPKAMPGVAATDIVTAQANYAELDRPGANVRIRLSSTVVGVRNMGEPAASQGVELVYARGGGLFRVHAANCILASWNMMIPYLCTDLPEEQKKALHELVKVPLIYTSVALRNWQSFKKLGVQKISAPGSYFTSAQLNWPVDIGSYKSVRSPDDPILLFMVRTPCMPGLSERDQHRAGRAELLGTSFEDFERNIRGQVGRMLDGTGFDPAQDIMAITVNRWAHGYAYEYNPLFDDFDISPDQRPHVIGRKRFGRIAIANSDSGAAAYTDSAMDQARRAVDEIMAMG